MEWIDLLVTGIVLALIFFAVKSLKKNKGSCGNCSSCSGCEYRNKCSSEDKTDHCQFDK